MKNPLLHHTPGSFLPSRRQDTVELTPFLQELKDTGTLTFRTSPEDKRQHGVDGVISISWPPPRWMYDAAKLCPCAAQVLWNTRAVVNGNSEPVTLVLNGGMECSVRYYDDHAKDIWSTVSVQLLDHWRIKLPD